MTPITDAQLIPICLSIILPISMLIYSNSRIGDAKETLRAEMATVRAEMAAFRAEMKLDFERLANKVDHLADLLATHIEEHHRE